MELPVELAYMNVSMEYLGGEDFGLVAPDVATCPDYIQAQRQSWRTNMFRRSGGQLGSNIQQEMPSLAFKLGLGSSDLLRLARASSCTSQNFHMDT